MTSKDLSKAAELYCEAARLGHTQAQFNLGWMYANGRGVARDDGIAAQLRHGFMREAEAMQTARSDLSAEGIERQFAGERNAPPSGFFRAGNRRIRGAGRACRPRNGGGGVQLAAEGDGLTDGLVQVVPA